MLDRQKIETILTRRFPGTTPAQIAAAANAIMGLGDEWEEILDRNPGPPLYHSSADCRDMRYLEHEFGPGSEFRLFRRRQA
jgi:hypothetical protein